MSTIAHSLVAFDLQSPLLPGVLAAYTRTWGHKGYEPQVRLHATYPGFKGIVAVSAPGEVAGYIYGTTALPGQWWPDRIAPVIGPERAQQRLYGSFCVAELGVVPEHRRQGLATWLMRAILVDLPHTHVTLSTECANVAARSLYERLGFGYLVERMCFTEGGEDYAVLDRPLPLVQPAVVPH